jgi:hypothetical protein
MIRHFIISPREIHILRFILEAYEGVGIVTTLQPRLGLIRLSIAPGCEDVVERILESEKDRLQLRPVVITDPGCGMQET